MSKNKVAATVVVLAASMLAVLLFGAFLEDGGFVATCKGASAPAGVVINEVMADNDATVPGPQRSFPDWIELYNAGTSTVDLGGMYLTNSLSVPKAWKFPKNTTLSPGGYLIVWADGGRTVGDGELHASFALGANAATIGLFASDGKTLLDSVVLGKQIRDVSYGRIPDGGSSWQYLTSPTPGSANQPNSSNEPLTDWAVLAIAILAIALIAAMVLSIKFYQRRKLYEYKQ
jgi:hypothetical protein